VTTCRTLCHTYLIAAYNYTSTCVLLRLRALEGLQIEGQLLLLVPFCTEFSESESQGYCESEAKEDSEGCRVTPVYLSFSLIRHHEYDVLQELLVAAALLEEGTSGGVGGQPAGQAGTPQQHALQVIMRCINGCAAMAFEQAL
jgi:hypothetical protein